jgi:seryl-tRNA synthetase
MLDIKFIRENKEAVQKGADKKHIDFDVEALLSLDEERRELLSIVEEKRTESNSVSAEIAKLEGDDRDVKIASTKELKDSLKDFEERLRGVAETWENQMLLVPNVPDETVPNGESDEDNEEIRVWGDKPEIKDPKAHHELMETHGMLDLDRGTKVAGFRGYFLKGDGVRLQFALNQFVFDFFLKKGFEPMIVPSLVRRDTLKGTGYIPQGEDDVYKTQDDLYLAGTGEVATMAYHSDEILEKDSFPKKYLAYSPCFRREIGTHGKDTKGLVRVHEFSKFEQVLLSESDHDTTVALHEEITLNAEEMLQALNVPYRVVVNCGGDLGLGQVKKYDIEAWVPSEDKYRETHSASYFHDFQTRRLNIRYKDEGETKFAHSLNNTAAASPRLLVTLIENYQQEDGSIIIPEVLRPYMGGQEVIGK